MIQIISFLRYIKRFSIALGIATIGLLSISGGPALAHNAFSDSSPADGEVLASSPQTWTITFTKAVPLGSASGQVVKEDGTRQDLSDPRTGATDNVIVFDLPQNLTGTVTGRWRLVGTDGHVISGRVKFTAPQVSVVIPSEPPVVAPSEPPVVTPSEPPVAPSEQIGSEETTSGSTTTEDLAIPESVRFLIRLLTFVSVVLLGGLLFTNWYIAQGTFSIPRGRLLTHIAVIGLTATPILSLWILIDDIRGGDGSFGDALSTTTSLSIGPMIMFRIGVGAAILFLTRNLFKRNAIDDRASAHLALLLAMYCVALAYGGHSRSLASPWLGIPTDVLHVISVCVWVGGLIGVMLVVLPATNIEQSLSAFERFGYAAERAVPVMVVTGVIQSLRLHGDVWSLFSSSHGVLLLLKIAVVIVMLLLGNRNRKVFLQRRYRNNSRTEASRAMLVRASIYEVLFGATTIGITAALVAVTPT